MAVLDRIRGKEENGLDKDFISKLNEWRMNLERSAPKRDECWEFYRGNHFAYVSDGNKLSFLASGSIGIPRRGKPNHRARQARNFIYDVVQRQASLATQQVPSYQVVPSTNDPDDRSAAHLAEKIALYGYDRWNLRDATINAVIHSLVGGEAFAWVYFDNNIGPFVEDELGSVGQGDVRCRIYGANQVFWVPGLRFEDSPCHVVEQAVDPDQLKNMPGFIGGPLTADADQRALSGKKNDKGKLVLRTDYLERPCPKYPEGRWITIANNRRIFEDRPYPGTGQDPVLRRLAYAPDPDSDRDLSLVAQLLDPQRTVNDAENKAVEWKNRCLFPQAAVAPGLMKKQRWTDEPGAIYEIPDPTRNLQKLDAPPVPDSLFTMSDRATDHLLRIAAQQDIPPGVESGRAIQALIEKNQARLGMFIASLAEWHGHVMHDCLVQVQQNYTEQRTIQIKGDFDWDSIEDFKGAQLRDQVDVRVYADSIEPQTRQAREQRVMNFVQMGAITPQEAMAAIQTGATDGLIRSFSQTEARVGRIIRNLKLGPEALAAMPMMPTGRLEEVPVLSNEIDPATGEQIPATDPMTGEVQTQKTGAPEMAPGWMPRYSDNLPLFKAIFEDWLSTEDYERQPPEVQQAANNIYAGVLQLEEQKNAEAQAAQNAQAEAMGMQNAVKPPAGKPNPSLPSLSGEGESA